MPTTTPTTLTAGQHAIIITGQDDVADGQLCRVLARSEEPNYATSDFPAGTDLRTYHPGEEVLVLCWTGFLVGTRYENLIAVTPANEVARAALIVLFETGRCRRDEMIVPF